MMRFALFALALIVTSPAFAQTDANARARELLAARHLDGAVVMQDVRRGTAIADATVGEKWEDGVLPLSTAKVFLAAMALDRGLHTSIDVPDLIPHGSDADARTLALELRHSVGTTAVLADLTRFGFPPCDAKQALNCFSLSPKTGDADWASTLSVGESNIRVTPARLSDFLGIIGRNGTDLHKRILNFATAHMLQLAMRDTVATGTAKGIRDRLPPGFMIGGKTGTGGTQPYDGIFAGLVFDAHARARYTVAVYVRGGGTGDGAAAEIAADMAAFVISTRMNGASDGL